MSGTNTNTNVRLLKAAVKEYNKEHSIPASAKKKDDLIKALTERGVTIPSSESAPGAKKAKKAKKAKGAPVRNKRLFDEAMQSWQFGGGKDPREALPKPTAAQKKKAMELAQNSYMHGGAEHHSKAWKNHLPSHLRPRDFEK